MSLLEDYGLLRIAESNDNFPYMVLAPQCPIDTDWKGIKAKIISTLHNIFDQYHVDISRVYLTGFSMGANGVWDLTAQTNALFAASIPISGWYEKDKAAQLLTTPIWAFHGDKDDVVPISGSESMVNAIIEMGGSPKFTRYPDFDHDHKIMYETYSNPELYVWLEEHRRIV